MIHIRRGIVRRVTAIRPGAQELEVEIDGGVAAAIAYPALGGEVLPGDTVLLNTTALDLELGTGGMHVVIAIEGRDLAAEPVPGHVMKARYTPVQTAVASVEETHAARLEASEGLAADPRRLRAAAFDAGADRGGGEAIVRRSGRLPDDGRRGPARAVSPGSSTSCGRAVSSTAGSRAGSRSVASWRP